MEIHSLRKEKKLNTAAERLKGLCCCVFVEEEFGCCFDSLLVRDDGVLRIWREKKRNGTVLCLWLREVRASGKKLYCCCSDIRRRERYSAFGISD